MERVIDFNNVSKKYRLGLTRTSVTAALSKMTKNLLSNSRQEEVVDKDLWALKDVSFELNKGESLAIIGPNGAGKTTILKLLANITQPTEGNINVNGRLSALIELGAGFHPELTGRENIYLNGTILGLDRMEIDRRFDEIVEFSELGRFIDTPIKRYSSGMSVRLGFAVAANIDSSILLVDEVLAVGDASFRQKCMERIKKLLDQGTSIVFVSHNLWLVRAVCDAGIYLNKGQVVRKGNIAEVIDLYDQRMNLERTKKFDVAQEIGEGNPDIEIEKIEILQAGVSTPDDLSNDQPAEINVHYVAFQDFEDINLVVRILRSDGLTCCAMRTSLDKCSLSIDRGKGIVSVTLNPIQLYGGNYYIQVVVRDSDDAHTITSSSSDWFYVKGSMLSHQDMNGVFEPNRSWSHTKVIQGISS